MSRASIEIETIPEIHPDDFPVPMVNAYWLSGDLRLLIDKTKPHCIPTTFPTPMEQDGPTCGLYALYLALTQFHPKASVPHPTEDAVDIPSLLSSARVHKLTVTGAFFRITLLKTLCDYYHFESNAHINTQKNYLKNLQDNLNKGRQLVVACDIGPGSFPASSAGQRTHWVMMFGYFYNLETLYFLVCHHNKIQVWNSNRLLEANRGLPVKNPKIETHDNQDYLTLSGPDGITYTPATSNDHHLNQFSFTFLSMGETKDVSEAMAMTPSSLRP